MSSKTPPAAWTKKPAVQAFAHLDAAARVGAAAPAARNLDEAGPEADGVVPGHRALVAAAQEVGKVRRRAPPGRAGVGRRVGEAAVEVGAEGGEEGVGGLAGREGVETQLGGQPVLQGAPEPFDAAFGLGRAGRDVADGELLEDAAEVGGVLGAQELLLQGPVRVIADEDVQAIAIATSRSFSTA
jgi:hypothetical protein